MPVNDFAGICQSKQKCSHTLELLDEMVVQLCDLIVESKEELDYLCASYKCMHLDGVESELHCSLLQLVVYGSHPNAIVSRSILAMTVPYKYLKVMLVDHVNAAASQMPPVIVPSNYSSIGKVQFTSLCKTFAILVAGNNIPKYSYTFCLAAEKVLQTKLPA